MEENKDKKTENQDSLHNDAASGNSPVDSGVDAEIKNAGEESETGRTPDEQETGRTPEEETGQAQEETTVSVEEEWAETLHINFDPSRLRQTPPPIPGQPSRLRIPDIPTSAGASTQNLDGIPPQSGSSFDNGQGNPPSANIDVINQPLPYARPYPQNRPMPATHLVAAIIITIFCCTIPGIIALIYSSKVTNRFMIGDYEGAEAASRNTEIWIIASFVLGAVSSAIYIPLMVL